MAPSIPARSMASEIAAVGSPQSRVTMSCYGPPVMAITSPPFRPGERPASPAAAGLRPVPPPRSRPRVRPAAGRRRGPRWRAREGPHAVTGTWARAKTEKPRSRAWPTSRQAPSVMTPRTDRTAAPTLTIPPHEDTSVRPPLATTMTSPGPAPAIAPVRMRAPPCSALSWPLSGSSSTVTANPATLGRPHIGRSPPWPGGSPQASRASDTVAVSSAVNWASRAGSLLMSFSETRQVHILKV